MPASLGLFLDPERQNPLPVLSLAEIIAPESPDDLVEGEPLKIYAANTGDTNLRDVSLHLDGDGAENVQLAVDLDGQPGLWAAPGESIFIARQTIFRSDTFEFWMRGVYHPDDAEGRRKFTLRFRAVSVG